MTISLSVSPTTVNVGQRITFTWSGTAPYINLEWTYDQSNWAYLTGPTNISSIYYLAQNVWASRTVYFRVTYGSDTSNIISVVVGGLPTTGMIYGYVTDGTSPLSTALIVATYGLIEKHAITDVRGYYSITLDVAGPYTVKATKYGYQEQTKYIVLAPVEQKRLDFTLTPISPPKCPDGMIGTPPNCYCPVGTEWDYKTQTCRPINVPPSCTKDTECPSGYKCQNGVCVPISPPPTCLFDYDCPTSYKCVDGKCVPKDTPPECTEYQQFLTERALIKGDTSDQVYLMEASKKRWITSVDLFTSCGWKWENIKVLPQACVDAVPEGESLTQCPSIILGLDWQTIALIGGVVVGSAVILGLVRRPKKKKGRKKHG